MEAKETQSFFARIQNVRNELVKLNPKKTGQNKYSNYSYFELGDFVGIATELFKSNNIFPWFEFEEDNKLETSTANKGPDQLEILNNTYKTIEYAKLTLFDCLGNEKISARCKTVEADVKGTSPIQAAGAKHTYYRRYLYLDVLDLAETDGVDAGDNTPVIPIKTTATAPVEAKPKADSDLMTEATRNEIKDYIKSKELGMKVVDVIKESSKRLGLDTALLKETDKEDILKTIDAIAEEEKTNE